MANKKKKAPKKVTKPVKKTAAKKTVAKKPLKKKTMPKKTTPKKAVKSTPKKVTKPEVHKPVVKPAVKVSAKKAGGVDLKSLVSIKPKAQPIIKKEKPRPSKVVIPKTTTKSAVKYEPEFTKSVLDSFNIDDSTPSMRYSDSDLNEFGDIILKKLDAAKKELAYLQGLITRKDEGGDMD